MHCMRNILSKLVLLTTHKSNLTVVIIFYLWQNKPRLVYIIPLLNNACRQRYSPSIRSSTMTTTDLSASLGIAATPEKLGTTSKATKNASHPSRMLSFKTVRLVQAGSLDDTVTNVMIAEKSSPEMANIE